MDPVLQEANQKIDQSLIHLKRELAAIRAGRANPSLIEEISVEAYGGRMKLVEVGTISTPQPSLLVVQVWDPSVVQAVQKAILEANIGLNPAIDGQTVRLPIPPLTEERRKEFVKQAHQKGEECKIALRQIRQDERSKFELEKDSGEFGDDELERRQKLLQDLIDKSANTVEELIKEKEAALMEV